MVNRIKVSFDRERSFFTDSLVSFKIDDSIYCWIQTEADYYILVVKLFNTDESSFYVPTYFISEEAANYLSVIRTLEQ